jgi:hypothetical protein
MGIVSAGFPRKSFVALIWIVPTIALAAFAVEKIYRERNPIPPVKPELMKVPIEMINADEKAKIVYVELETQSIPEPSSMILLPLSALALLRRRR